MIARPDLHSPIYDQKVTKVTPIAFYWRRLGFALIALSCIPLAGCSKGIFFEEEVILSDGAKVEIQRVIHLRRSCEAFSCGWALDQSEMRLDGIHNSTWNKRLIPLLLDKYQGKYILIATVIYCDDKEFGHPEPNYIQFELTPSGWERRELQAYIFGRKANLLIAANWYAGEPKKIDITTKETRNELAAVRNYKKVLARVTPSNC